MEKHYRCIVCFENVDGEVHRRSEGATLCDDGPGESLRQDAKRIGVVLQGKVWSGREVRENSTTLGGCPFNGPLSGTKYPTRAASPIQNASTPKSSLPFSKHRRCALLCTVVRRF